MNTTGVLLIIFLVLKLAGIVTWSWWLVLAPLWVPIALTLIIAGIILLLGGTIKVSDSRRK